MGIFGGGGGGGGGQSMPDVTTQFVREAPGIEERKIGLMDVARSLAEKPINIPALNVQPLSTLEQQGVTAAGQTGVGAPTTQAGIGSILQAQAGPDISQFYNPYQSYVLDELNRQSAMQQNQLAAQSVQAGAFGGGRQGVQAAEQEQARLRALGLAQAQGFQTALGAAQQQQQVGLQAGSQLANIGQMQQGMAQQDINQLMAAGGLQRQLAQQTLDAQRAQQLQQAYEPFQRAEFLKSQYQGGPTSQSGITQTTAPTVNPLAQAAGAGLGAYAAYQTAQASRPVIQIGNQPTK